MMNKIYKYQIIFPSQTIGDNRLEIADAWYRGLIPGLLCGWCFEFRTASGDIRYGSDEWLSGTAEDFCASHHPDSLFLAERMRGWEPTGRVVFRGYGREYFDRKYRAWDVQDVCVSDIDFRD